MCGRYYLDTLPETLMEYFSVSETPALTKDFNITPSRSLPIIRQGESSRELIEARWGLVPFWAKDAKIGYRMINARSETVAQKPAFRSAWKNRRCLIPASGFYEWQRRDKSNKQPYVITGKDRPLLVFGGLWETWRKAAETIVSFSILTTKPNAVMTPIHDRMPVIIEPKNFARWLEDEPNSLDDCLVPCDNAVLNVYPVGAAVNSPANNGPELLRPMDDTPIGDS